MDDKKTILVTGANGQLGNEIRVNAATQPDYHFLFVTKKELAIDDTPAVDAYFASHNITWCINCAAYTEVDKAESEPGKAMLINGTSVGNLAAVCKNHNAQLIHISTDYVFDGTATQPYKEGDYVSPVNFYGASKLKGEQLAIQNNPNSIIIRTSWVYSSFGNNFVKTMLRLMGERESINVVNDQQGCPTYGADLAAAIMHIVQANIQFSAPEIFNYSNAGAITWYQFALAIREFSGSKCTVNPIAASQYPTPAKRPQYSVMDTTKIQQTFKIKIPAWKDSLQKCVYILLADKA